MHYEEKACRQQPIVLTATAPSSKIFAALPGFTSKALLPVVDEADSCCSSLLPSCGIFLL
jgi:hypothetical protein